MLQRGILNRSCEILEEEFYENLQKVENSSISLRSFANLDTNTSKLLMPILNFIEKNYLLTEFRRKPQNYIELDDYQTPIWAIFFVLVRSGMNKMISKLVGCYKGRTKVKEFGEFFEKYLIAQNENKELESVDRKEAMELIINSNETIDVFQYSLYIIITKHCEIISMELISQIGDYLWFNVNISLYYYFIN